MNRIACLALLLPAVAALAQNGTSETGQRPAQQGSDPRAAFRAFCDTHAEECTQLREVHQTEKAACSGNQTQTSGQISEPTQASTPSQNCEQARAAVRDLLAKLTAEGLPPRPGRPGMEGRPERAGTPKS